MNRTCTLLHLAVLTCVLPLAAHAQDAAKPVHGYRVTYTLTTSDAGKRVGVEHFAMTVNTAPATFQDGRTYSGRGSLKIGEKVPVATGSYSDTKTNVQTQFTYLDVGINIDATVTEAPNGLLVSSKVEQSNVAPERTVISGVSEPVIRQMVLTNSSTLTAGKAVTVGSLDLPDSQRHIDIEVSVEPLP
jgi:hypothetical protein